MCIVLNGDAMTNQILSTLEKPWIRVFEVILQRGYYIWGGGDMTELWLLVHKNRRAVKVYRDHNTLEPLKWSVRSTLGIETLMYKFWFSGIYHLLPAQGEIISRGYNLNNYWNKQVLFFVSARPMACFKNDKCTWKTWQHCNISYVASMIVFLVAMLSFLVDVFQIISFQIPNFKCKAKLANESLLLPLLCLCPHPCLSSVAVAMVIWHASRGGQMRWNGGGCGGCDRGWAA